MVDEFKDEETLGVLTADLAVAPLAIEFGGEVEVVDDVRREVGGVARPGRGGGVLVVAIFKPKKIVSNRYQIVSVSAVFLL